MLPSRLLQDGDTLDLECAEIAVAYEQYVRKNPGVKTDHGLTQEQMMASIERVRNGQDGKKNEER